MNKKKLGKEARSATLYVRVSPSSKSLVEGMAASLGISEAAVVDAVLQHLTPEQIVKMVTGKRA